ncbi:sushi domain-containing protein 3-like [Lates japonicus]|uniref:Sushi domain-containing protein 3-like protein n=1 Tax=Lates japonicus TaxID=270547 RepID=A0AAD3MAG1_LATJO|nr:sushi domain-containing protein 3-like protein [Lates japonicus]
MSAATASITDVSRTDITNKNDGRDRNNSGQFQAQCTPIPLPALGTQKIIQGNGTNVGTVISLQCPAKHRLVGRDLTCVMDANSTHWEGETYCKPMASFDDYGFRVAVLASIVSSAIICFMSVAFLTCCLLDCIKEDKRKKQENESDVWQWEEQAQHQEDNRSRYSHKGRNNNNNTQEKLHSLWDTHNPAMCDNMRGCRCNQEYAYGPVLTYGRTPPLAALPGRDYDQPLLPRNPESAQIPGPPQYPGPPLSSAQTTSPGVVQISAVGSGLVWQYGRPEQSSLPGANPSITGEPNTRNINPAKEFNIRIISV